MDWGNCNQKGAHKRKSKIQLIRILPFSFSNKKEIRKINYSFKTVETDESETTRHYSLPRPSIINIQPSFKCTYTKNLTLTVLCNSFATKPKSFKIESRRVYLTPVEQIFRQGCASLYWNPPVNNLFTDLILLRV